ncbi:unnamed protein product [Coregonus sp. 'balchen']|nr:unnamed protein product [Coregonus sp. 'balchen']
MDRNCTAVREILSVAERVNPPPPMVSGSTPHPLWLFEGSSPKKREKLKTLLCYFRSVTEQSTFFFNYQINVMTYWTCNIHKKMFGSSPELEKVIHFMRNYCPFILSNNCYGFDPRRNKGNIYLLNGDRAKKVDFANRFVGGGVTSSGLVQEEIRFLINPELIVSRLFTEALQYNECLVITAPGSSPEDLLL